ncbi:AFR010Cp [Eremothecium gossypii ATCC 10895]|uniref:DNA damage-inducible protein 1 n=1 Tax=Eremothecium gossypii (strain ATCC 10895 / CBS 109.51 / FGSC 9923 / NRRL Y-1056) TaxID=284811 RepID=DDI1_EREGS|nr:AFR010Cp [Eremothecium gossypii ATCC 10895]Q754R2.1 RecName: Full=DNA damage-inducible protein 1 [Eremothecium gossypii ATCC 10895]AAS53381.1 AFR010Cp [Eremothecium gossypii ATCC 10895]AEY97692.1 FAFR010Cp [Eremothecium gossypii FDAG1]
MNVTVSNEVTDELLGPFELSDDITLMDFMALIDFDENEQALWHNMRQLKSVDREKTLMQLGIVGESLVVVKAIKKKATEGSTTRASKASAKAAKAAAKAAAVARDTPAEQATTVSPVAQVPVAVSPAVTAAVPTQPTSPSGGPAAANDIITPEDEYIETFRKSLLNSPSLASNIPIPGVNQLIQDSQLFKQLIGPVLLHRRAQQQAANQMGTAQSEYVKLMSNPDDPSNQARISELINQQEIDEQLHKAMEYTPEVFASVNMLYINMEINGHPVKAFVDSGAQSTIMSTALAERTGLGRLVDKRFRGIARGVGKGEIIGRVHAAQVKIETQFIPCSFIVLDTNVDLLLGLDMLRRYQACVDLKENVLKIAGIVTPFLPEAEIPKHFDMDPSAEATNLPSTSPLGNQKAAPEARDAGVGSALLNRSTPATAERTHAEEDVRRLMDLGFSRAEVLKALDHSQGNAEYAAAFLFQ